MDFNVDLLAQETLALSQKLHSSEKDDPTFELKTSKSRSESENDLLSVPEQSLDNDRRAHHEEAQMMDRLFALAGRCDDHGFSEKDSQAIEFPQTCGVLYYIDKGVSTFCIRGLACHNIKDSAQKIMNGHDKSVLKDLKIDFDEFDFSKLRFFQTQAKELAEVIGDELFKRRFPLDEVSLCNLADPGFSWWLNELESGVEIYFKSHGLERKEKFSCLGPMGDLHLAQIRFTQLQKIFSNLNDSGQFELSSRSLKFSITQSSNLDFSYKLKEIFRSGEFLFSNEDFKVHRTMFLYLRELAAMRRFWIDIQENLSS